MPSRRGFLAGIAVLGLSPAVTWADAGSPDYLAAAKLPDGSYHLFGLATDGREIFSIPLPGRGHAAAAHPRRPEAVAFARRPGTFAIVLDCDTCRPVATLTAPVERHFYGHGVFSADGRRLYTTENAYELGEGRIGIWAADEGYRRIGEFPSGGIGPHDVTRLPGTATLVIANGGIDTHPETRRQKLNLPTMQPNLTYATETGEIVEQIQLPPEMRLNSIRHLSIRDDGLVAFGCQWQGDLAEVPPLAGLHRLGGEVWLLEEETDLHHALQGYVGSIAFSGDGETVGFTAPRGNHALVYRVSDGALVRDFEAADICGIAPSAAGHFFTTGTGYRGPAGDGPLPADAGIAWDNHVVRAPAA